jgi:hypothetical protein
MKNFVDYTSRKCFASARVASPRLRNITHTRKISFSGRVIHKIDPNNYLLEGNVKLNIFLASFATPYTSLKYQHIIIVISRK